MALLRSEEIFQAVAALAPESSLPVVTLPGSLCPHDQTSASLQVLSLWPQDWLGGQRPTSAPGGVIGKGCQPVAPALSPEATVPDQLLPAPRGKNAAEGWKR